jgi:hypothetical protein
VRTNEQNLPLENLWRRHPGLTKAIADAYVEAASVCLTRHHRPPTQFTINDEADTLDAVVNWRLPDEVCLAAYANEIDATEWGAYAFALASMELTRGLVAIRRAETKTGVDYYVFHYGMFPDDLESCFRLEISGTDRGTEQDLMARLKSKIVQASRPGSNLPALAAVVGFKIQRIAIKEIG